MGSSFINFRECGFWARDGFFEAIQLLLFEEIQLRHHTQVTWLHEYQKELAFQSLPLISGGMSMHLDEVLTDEERIKTIIQLIEAVTTKITSDKAYLTGDHLNSLRRTIREFLVTEKEFNWNQNEIEQQVNDGRYSEHLPSENYLRGFDLLQKLIAGQISFKANSPITYWND
jgi:hypothetical protein